MSKRKIARAMGYGPNSSFKTLKKLLYIPEVFWEKELVPILKELGINTPQTDFNVAKWINPRMLVGSLSSVKFKLVVKESLKRLGVQLVRTNNGGYALGYTINQEIDDFLSEISITESQYMNQDVGVQVTNTVSVEQEVEQEIEEEEVEQIEEQVL